MHIFRITLKWSTVDPQHLHDAYKIEPFSIHFSFCEKISINYLLNIHISLRKVIGVFDFKNNVAVVTGSSRSIGRGIVLALATGGCAVTINYSKSRDEAEEVVNTIRQMGGKAVAVKCGVSKREEVENLSTATVDAFETRYITGKILLVDGGRRDFL